MKSFAFMVLISAATLLAQVPKGAESNAALRYWNAFAQMSDQKLTDAQTKELEAMANGSAAWNEASFGKLLDDNHDAIETMVRGTALPYCVWGVDFELGEAAPIPQVGRGRALARLNVLTAERLAAQGKSREATDHLIAGLRFGRDLSAGMSLIGALVGASAMSSDLNTAIRLSQSGLISGEDKSRLTAAVKALPPDLLDWSQSIRFEGEAIHSGLVHLRDAQDPANLVKEWGMGADAEKDPRPTEADIHQVEAILKQVEAVFHQSPYANSAALAEVQRRVARLKPVAAAFIPNFERTNARRKELQELDEKFLAGS